MTTDTLNPARALNPTGGEILASGLCPSVLELGLRIWAERPEFKVFRVQGQD